MKAEKCTFFYSLRTPHWVERRRLLRTRQRGGRAAPLEAERRRAAPHKAKGRKRSSTRGGETESSFTQGGEVENSSAQGEEAASIANR